MTQPAVSKDEIITAVANELKIGKADAAAAVNATFTTIANSLLANRDVCITGVGFLRVMTRSARVSRNPKTGESCNVPERKVIKFTRSSRLNSNTAK